MSSKRPARASPAWHPQPRTRQRKYARKTKRFSWPETLHRRFIGVIFELGLEQATPKLITNFLKTGAGVEGVTSAHVKSHLQKYRAHEQASRDEFFAFYDESTRKNGRRRRRTNKWQHNHTRFVFPITPSTEMLEERRRMSDNEEELQETAATPPCDDGLADRVPCALPSDIQPWMGPPVASQYLNGLPSSEFPSYEALPMPNMQLDIMQVAMEAQRYMHDEAVARQAAIAHEMDASSISSNAPSWPMDPLDSPIQSVDNTKEELAQPEPLPMPIDWHDTLDVFTADDHGDLFSFLVEDC